MLIVLLQDANLGLAFALELGVLAALGYFGFVSGKSWPGKVGLGLGLPIVAALIWGMFGSPQATWRLHGIWFLLLQIVFFGSATVALYASARRRLGLLFALLLIVNFSLSYAWGQA